MSDKISDKRYHERVVERRREEVKKQVIQKENQKQFQTLLNPSKPKSTEPPKAPPKIPESQTQKEVKKPTTPQKTEKTQEKQDQKLKEENNKLKDIEKDKEEEVQNKTVTENAVRQKQEKSSDDQGFSQNNSDQFFQKAVLIASQVTETSGPQVTQKTPAIIHEIVQQIQVATLPTGEQTVEISLKGEFEGTTLKLSGALGQKGKIKLELKGLSQIHKALIKQHQDELKATLLQKNIQLEQITF